MDPTVQVAIIGLISAVLVAVIGVWTARLANRASKVQVQVEERQKLLEAYGVLNDDLEQRNKNLSETVEKLTNNVNELYDLREEDRRVIRDLRENQDVSDSALRVIIDYNKLLVELLRKNGIEVPPGPSVLSKYTADHSDHSG